MGGAIIDEVGDAAAAATNTLTSSPVFTSAMNQASALAGRFGVV